MKKTILFQIFQKLSTIELRRLRPFSESPYFNRRSDLIVLIDYLINEQNKRNPNFERNVVYQYVYNGEAFDLVKFRLLLSRTLKLIETFLAVNQFMQNESAINFNTLKGYRQMNEEKAFIKQLKIVKSNQKQEPYRNLDFWHQSYLTEYEYYDFVQSHNRNKDTNLQEMVDIFDTYFMATKLKQACLLVSHERISVKKYEEGIIDAIIEFLHKRPDLLDISVISIYYHAYITLTDDNAEEHFKTLRKIMRDSHQLFSATENRDIALIAINYCIRQANVGKTEYLNEMFSLFEESLKENYLLENDELNHITYNNIATLAIRLEKFKWVKHFINDFKEKLGAKYRENYYKFNMAKLYYWERNYDDAMRYLSKIKSQDVFLILRAKNMMVKIYFERKEIDALESLLQSLKSFIRRQKINDFFKEQFNNTIKFTYKLIKLQPYDLEARANLYEEISNTKLLVEKKWFLQQLSQE